MTVYALNPSRFTNNTDLQAAVGRLYHLGLSNGTVWYGYILEPSNAKDGGFRQRSDTASKESLINYSSGNIVDRDLAFFPRVTDGDFSGGGYQEVWLDSRRYFDSDLDPRVPGYLQLRPQWTRISKAGLTVGPNFQVVAFNGDFWFTFGEANGNVYSANAGTTTVPTVAAILALDTDGSYLYAGTASQLYRSADGVTWTPVTSSINGTATQWWVINQGTNGYFAYYQSGANLLYKIDLTQAFTIAAAAQPQVPVGANAINIVDLVEYQTSIAILTVDVRGPGFDVWYFDGNNLTRIVRVEGYIAQGMCQTLGALYVSAYALGFASSPILAKIDNGSYEVVVKPGSPFPTAGQSCLQPRASSQFVYWPITSPSIRGISPAVGIVLEYNVLTGAVSHLPMVDVNDYYLTGGRLRVIAVLGEFVAECWVYTPAPNAGYLQYQTPALGAIKYATNGWLVSSRIDFATPGIAKRFRRIEVTHSPLNAGERILVEAFVDTDPLAFTTALTPVPSSATVTNSTVGSSLTSLTFGTDTIGKALYFAIQLTAGTSNLTTPRVSYASIEIGGTWAFELNLGCTSKRGLLDGQGDETQPSGKDLAYLLLLAYENGQNLTLFHRNGQSYVVTIESLELWSPSPKQPSQPQEIRDEEWIVHVILRQVA